MINVKLDNKAKNTVAKTLNLGEGSGSLYTYWVQAEDNNSNFHTFTFQCASSELDSYDKLIQYLLSEGYYPHNEKAPYYTPILGVFSDSGSYSNINGLFAYQDGQSTVINGSTIHISSGELYHDNINLKPENFNIILVTE